MPQNPAASGVQNAINKATAAIELYGPEEMARRAGFPPSTVRDHFNKGFDLNPIRCLKALESASIVALAELEQK